MCVASGALVGLMAGLLGGLLIWLFYRAYFPVFQIPSQFLMLSVFASAEEVAAAQAAIAKATMQNAMLLLAVWGTVLTIAVSLYEFLCRRSWRKAVIGLVVGGLIAAAVSCLGGVLGTIVYGYLKGTAESSPTTRTLITHAAMLALLGGGVGVAFGTVLGGRRAMVSCGAYGFLAGVLSGILWPILAASVLTRSRVDLVVPTESEVALFWIVASSILIGLLVISGARNAACQKTVSEPKTDSPPEIETASEQSDSTSE